MVISPTTAGETAAQVIAAPQNSQGPSFSRFLHQQMEDSGKSADAAPSIPPLQTGNSASASQRSVVLEDLSDNDPSAPILLGRTSKSDPTVSEILITHPAYRKDCWNIIHSGINRGKAYTKIPSGSRIYLNPANREIFWKPQNTHSCSTQTEKETLKNDAPVLLGTISKNDPTVSDLLIRHPTFGKECWDIIHSGINRGKAYTEIPSGSRIYLDPATREISWKQNAGDSFHAEKPGKTDLQEKPVSLSHSDPFSTGLAKAVKPYLGKPYQEMNCFELVVQGMEELGIRYYGRGGLGEQLIKQAAEKGLSTNHYLSGEGLIETSGSRIYAKSVPKVFHPTKEASRLYQEVRPLLHEGMILSFSTTTRGHTGIISRREEDWTYINSGHMDNRIEGRASKGVGEELLNAEIRNWFRLAANRTEPLQITVGRLVEDKLQAFLKDEQASLL